MVAPTTNLDRTRTAAPANPTPPTNVNVYYQGTPPTPRGTPPFWIDEPQIIPGAGGVFADPFNGATSPDLAGKAEADGTEVTTAVGSTSGRSVLGNFTEAPNTSHPSSSVRGPINLTLPVIIGTPAVGQVLGAVAGTWSGTMPIVSTFQWFDQTNTLLGSGPSLTLIAGHVGKRIKIVETATNPSGVITATSALTAPVV